MKTGVKAEWHAPLEIIVGSPGLELFDGSLVPNGALFQSPFDRYEAIEEHEELIKLLNKYGNVHRIDELLLKDLGSLKELAKHSLQINASNLNLEDKQNFSVYKEQILSMMNPKDLIQIIHTQPFVELVYTGTNTDFDMVKKNNPLYNLVFTRDQQITTDKGIVLGRMNSKQRSSEVAVMKQVFQNLGVENLYGLSEGKMEGGDFIPAKNIAFMGTGLRTDYNAINELISRKLMGYDEVVIVKDKFKNQEEMHLDTYFNVISENSVIILEDKVDMSQLGDFKNKLNLRKELMVDVYKKRNDGSYELKDKNKSFTTYLKEKEFEVIPISKDEQMAYGINFLTVGQKEVIGIDIGAKQNLSDKYKKLEKLYGKTFNYFDTNINYKRIDDELMKKYERAGIKYIPIKFNMMNALYGSIHCLTQVVKRKAS